MDRTSVRVTATRVKRLAPPHDRQMVGDYQTPRHYQR
jgi:hypothetical protein